MARKKTQTLEPDPFELQMREETAKALNARFRSTFERIQQDYAGVGTSMAEAANSAIDDQEFVDFLFSLYNNSTTILHLHRQIKEHEAFPQAMTMALLTHKMAYRKTINVPCHVEDILVRNRYLRRFVREMFRDIYTVEVQKVTNIDQ